MPPEPGSTSSATDVSNSATTSPADPEPAAAATSNRWSAVSCSRNADTHYKRIFKDPAKAYSYICLCPPFFEGGSTYEGEGGDVDDNDDDADGWEDVYSDAGSSDWAEEAANNTNAGREEAKDAKPKCDGKNCMCGKPAAEHPEHVWKITRAGRQKYFMQALHANLRNPNSFGDMYVFKNFDLYGMIEVVQNLLLDYCEAAGNLREQWVVCEATAMWLLDKASQPMLMYVLATLNQARDQTGY